MSGWQKPPRGTSLNRAHPLANGLVACTLCNEGGGYPCEIVHSDQQIHTVTATWTWNPTPNANGYGLYISAAGSYNGPRWPHRSDYNFGTGNFTIGLLGTFYASTTVGPAFSNGGGTNQWRLQPNLNQAGSTESGAFSLFTYDGSPTYVGASGAIVDGEVAFYIAVRNGTAHTLYKNGIRIGSNTGTARNVTGSKTSGFGFFWDAGSTWSGGPLVAKGARVYSVQYNRALLADEVARLSAYPYEMFIPPSPARRIYVTSSSGSEQALAGQIDVLSGTSGALYALRTLSGQINGQSALSGNCYLLRPLFGQIDATSTTAADLYRRFALSGQSDGLSAATARLDRSLLLGGSAGAQSSISGLLYLSQRLSGQIAGLSALSGDLSLQGQVLLSGSLVGQTGASGAIALAQSLSGQIDGQSTAQAALSRLFALAGQSAGLSTVIGTITLDRASVLLSGNIPAMSALSGALDVSRGLSGSITAIATGDGNIQLSLKLTGQAEAIAALTANLSVVGQSTLGLVIDPSISSITAKRVISSITIRRTVLSK